MGKYLNHRLAKKKRFALWPSAEHDSLRRPDSEWVAISAGASQDEKDGHFHWHYRHLLAPGEHNREKGGWLLGSKGIQGPRSSAVFTRTAHSRRFKVGLRSIYDLNFLGVKNSLERLLPDKTGLVFIYEGSLANYCLTLYLAPRFQSTTFFFNFFWPRQWSQLVQRHRLLWRLMRPVFQNQAQNIVLLADTPKYSAFISSSTKCRINPFPVFTPFQFAPIAPLAKRTTDVVISVKRPEELDFSLRVMMAVPSEISLKAVVIGPMRVVEKVKLYKLPESVNLSTISTALPEHSYVQLLNTAKVVFLPYLKEHYELGSSGKLVEACQAGCSVLVPEESGLSSQMKDTDPVSWATFSPSAPDKAATNLIRLLQVAPEPTQRLHSQEEALSYLKQHHLQRLRETHHRAVRPTSRWIWMVALTLGSLLSFATHWERENVKKRFGYLFDPMVTFFGSLHARHMTRN